MSANVARWGLLLGLMVMSVACQLLVAIGPVGAASTFTVNRTTDEADADLTDNVCDTDLNPVPRGLQCTLRAAIEEANDTSNSGGPDLIKFSITGNGPHTITPASVLPTITESVTIDGYTEGDLTPTTDDDATENTLAKGTNAKLLVELDGTNISGSIGLDIEASNTTVRGLVINRFARGINVSGANNVIEGNFVGTDPSGTQGPGNGVDGIFIISGSGNVVGGTATEDRNLISGNGTNLTGNGVEIKDECTNTKVQGNLIGTKKDGISPLGNSGHGVWIVVGDETLVGGAASASNIIAFNGGDGVSVQDSLKFPTNEIVVATGNKVLRNSIFSNGGLGIDLVPRSATEHAGTNVPAVNDPGDEDEGANGLQNKPNLTSAVTTGGTTTVEGVLDTKPDTTFTVQFFSNPSNGDEGKKFVGQKQVPTDSDGRVTFTFTPPNKVAAGQKVTATATGPEGTSEFSAPKSVG